MRKTKAEIIKLEEKLIRNLKNERITAKNSLHLAEDVSGALHKMEKVKRILEVLPGIDCGLCGCPTCRTLAEDIARGNASIRRCIVLKVKDPAGLNHLAKVWGEALSKSNKMVLLSKSKRKFNFFNI